MSQKKTETNDLEMTKAEKRKLLIIRICVLVLLTFQTSSFFLLTRYSRTQKEKGEPFWSHVWEVIIKSPVLSPPALMYFCQNFLVSVSLQNLRTAYFTVLNQLKILTTAFFSVIILRRSLTLQKWSGLVVLLLGVVLVKWEDSSSDDDKVTSNLTGLITAIIIPILSGLSGVYMELFVKKQQSTFSIWDRNLQLSVYSIVFAFATTFIFDYESILTHGYFHGYTLNAVLLPILLGCGGLIVALVIKYSNNIIKGFATSISIILSTVFSTMFWGFKLNPYFLAGVVLVIISLFTYMEVVNIRKLFKKKEVVEVVLPDDDKGENKV